MSGKYGSVVILSKSSEEAQDDEEQRTPTPRTPLKQIDPNILFSPTNNPNQTLFSPYLKTPNMAVKSQQLVRKAENSTPIREFKIQKELTKLRVGKLNMFPNVFSSFASTTCPEDDVVSSDEEEEQKSRKKKKVSPHYFNIVMEKCDGQLGELIKNHADESGKLSLSVVKAISFQLLFALSIAQEIGFQHNDMHERNILYKKLPNSATEKKGIAFFEKIDNDECVWLVDCDFILKIADYGLSRIENEDVAEINSGNVFHSDAFNSDLERVKEILTKRLKLSAECSEEDGQLFSSLKRSIKLNCGVTAKSLLAHEFFDSMQSTSISDLSNYHKYYGAKHPKRKETLGESLKKLNPRNSLTRLPITPEKETSKPLSPKPATPLVSTSTSTFTLPPLSSTQSPIPVRSRKARRRIVK